MRFFSPVLLALATVSTTNAVALPATDGQPLVPELPEGFFAGYNNPDGTSTFHFLDTNENITFTPIPAPDSASLTKRQTPWAKYGCWGGTLDRVGVDTAMNLMRDRVSHTPIGVGQFNDWPPYFGYNANGVYVYVCENSGKIAARYAFDRSTINMASLDMDLECGPYVPGYVQYDYYLTIESRLFGKAKSGTAVCQGNPRSPR